LRFLIFQIDKFATYWQATGNFDKYQKCNACRIHNGSTDQRVKGRNGFFSEINFFVIQNLAGNTGSGSNAFS
jgi:hypothetical protein